MDEINDDLTAKGCSNCLLHKKTKRPPTPTGHLPSHFWTTLVRIMSSIAMRRFTAGSSVCTQSRAPRWNLKWGCFCGEGSCHGVHDANDFVFLLNSDLESPQEPIENIFLHTTCWYDICNYKINDGHGSDVFPARIITHAPLRAKEAPNFVGGNLYPVVVCIMGFFSE